MTAGVVGLVSYFFQSWLDRKSHPTKSVSVCNIGVPHSTVLVSGTNH